MDISINGLGLGITDRFRSYATEKADKISHLADKALAFEVKVSRHNEKNSKSGSSGDDRVELTLVGPGPLVRAEATGSDKYVAFDVAIDKLVERLRRAKDRQKVHRGQHRPTSLREAANSGGFGDLHAASIDVIERVATGEIPIVSESAAEDDDWSPVVIRKKVFDAMPMTVDDALYFMELVGHDFYLFIDAETDRPSVVYRRKGWDYGVIGLQNQAG
ncbi:MAG: ribosome-associated translation inhibitor RaiA [Actinomycetota bacterium]